MDPTDEDPGVLRDFTRAKQRVTELVRAARQLIQERDHPEVAERLQELLVRLAEDRFNLAVVGQFKRGKSSLLNAIIGRELLPTGLVPLTSAITALCYGPRERVVLRRRGWVLDQEISPDELPAYVTERGNPGNERGLIEARIELPLRALRRGLYFIDTPGIGSSRQENTATTQAFLSESDAVIFVTGVDAPLSEAEEDFLKEVRAHVNKLFVVVNKTDLAQPDELPTLLDYIRGRLSAVLGTAEPRLLSLSARRALAAQATLDADDLRASGLPDLEGEIATFLGHEQGRTFLLGVLDRAVRALDASTLASITQVTEKDASGSSLGRLRGEMQTLHHALTAGASLPLEGAEAPVADTRPLEEAIASRHPTPRSAAREGTERPSCLICAAQTQAIFHFFAHWQYTLSISDTARRAFAAVHGFCPAHTWQFQQLASSVGISEGYTPLIEAMAAALARALQSDPTAMESRLREVLPRVETCPACRVLRETEREEVWHFLGPRASPEGGETAEDPSLPPSQLCLPHLAAVLAVDSGSAVGQRLVRGQLRYLYDLADDLRAYLLKRDALRRGLLNADEESAWQRALLQLVGQRTARPM